MPGDPGTVSASILPWRDPVSSDSSLTRPESGLSRCGGERVPFLPVTWGLIRLKPPDSWAKLRAAREGIRATE